MDVFDYIFHYVDFANRNIGELIGTVLVSLQSPGGAEPTQELAIAGFSRGALRAEEAIGGYDGRLGSMRGVLEGRFSDRQDIWGTPMAGGVDEIALEVLASADTRNVNLMLNLMSWGHVREPLVPIEVRDGVLHATGAAVGGLAPSAAYVIAFSEGAPGLDWRAPEG